MRMKIGQRRSTNVSLPADIVLEAKALGLNISQACEKGVVAEISAKRREKWLAENADAIEARNAWVGKNGLPLARFRQF
jgi:antitoxin CcdA